MARRRYSSNQRQHPLASGSKPLPSNPCAWQSNRHTKRIYEKLGIDTAASKIPKTMHGRFKIDGWTVIVKRSKPGARVGTPRIFIDQGGREIPLGRVYQGLCFKSVFRSRRKASRMRGPKGRFE
jgi:hypothetical protein